MTHSDVRNNDHQYTTNIHMFCYLFINRAMIVLWDGNTVPPQKCLARKNFTALISRTSRKSQVLRRSNPRVIDSLRFDAASLVSRLRNIVLASRHSDETTNNKSPWREEGRKGATKEWKKRVGQTPFIPGLSDFQSRCVCISR